MTFNDNFKTWTGVGVAGFIVLLAGSGKEFFAALMAFPALVSAWSAGLPLGVWSVFLAFIVGMCANGFALWWLPDTKGGHRAASTISILVAVAITVAQAGSSAGSVLNAIWMGFAAGFFAAYCANRLGAVFTAAGKVGDRPDADPKA